MKLARHKRPRRKTKTIALPSVSKAFRDYRKVSNETAVLVRAISPLIKGRKILADIGAGNGSITSALSKGRRIIAIEAFANNAAELKKLLPKSRHRVINKSIEDTHLPVRSVDAIVCSHALYYVRNVRDVIHNVFRWLKPGGVAVFVLLAQTGDQSAIIKKYRRKYCDENNDEIILYSGELAGILRDVATRIKIKQVRSYCGVKTELDQINFLSFALDVPSSRLAPSTKSQFKDLIRRKRPYYRPGKASTIHDIISCQSPLV